MAEMTEQEELQVFQLITAAAAPRALSWRPFIKAKEANTTKLKSSSKKPTATLSKGTMPTRHD